MVDRDIKTSPSAEETLAIRGLKLMKKIGEGSYAEVYLVEFQNEVTKEKSKLACKIIDSNKAPQDFVKKFLPREVEILLKLSHPHIIQVHSIFQRKMKCYMLMRFAESGDLLQYILKHGQLPENRTRVWFGQIASAIDYLHGKDIAHRDLKCENVLITANQNAKLSDFGFARFCVDAKKKPLLSSTFCGSLSYASPEILRGRPYAPRNADVWSLGVLLYVMLNKSIPFDDTHTRKLYNLQIKKRWKFRPKVVNFISEQCKQLVAEMLEPDINRRPTISQVISSDWLTADSQFGMWNMAEFSAIKKEYRASNISSTADQEQLDRTIEILTAPSNTDQKSSTVPSVQGFEVGTDDPKILDTERMQ